jgi:hypothetical protein
MYIPPQRIVTLHTRERYNSSEARVPYSVGADRSSKLLLTLPAGSDPSF